MVRTYEDGTKREKITHTNEEWEQVVPVDDDDNDEEEEVVVVLVDDDDEKEVWGRRRHQLGSIWM